MNDSDLAKLLWDLANAITAFAIVQSLLFAYACARPDVGNVINRKAVKLALALMITAIGVGQCIVVWWSGARLCVVDAAHCGLHWEATSGRIFCIAGLLGFSIVILYARQILAGKPFDD